MRHIITSYLPVFKSITAVRGVMRKYFRPDLYTYNYVNARDHDRINTAEKSLLYYPQIFIQIGKKTLMWESSGVAFIFIFKRLSLSICSINQWTNQSVSQSIKSINNTLFKAQPIKLRHKIHWTYKSNRCKKPNANHRKRRQLSEKIHISWRISNEVKKSISHDVYLMKWKNVYFIRGFATHEIYIFFFQFIRWNKNHIHSKNLSLFYYI